MLTAALFGLFHGVNPAMGWLFALFRALFHKDRRLLFRSLGPIALGHAVSVGLVLLVVSVASSVLPVAPVRWGAAAVVLLFGLYKLWRAGRHPAWRTMQVSNRDLFLWSFLCATSHGSGLMLVPALFGYQGLGGALGILGLHSLVMLTAMAGCAVLVHDRFDFTKLRRFWPNFDLVWAYGLVVAGVLSIVAAGSHSHT
jgi:hypothetical protein